MARGTRFIGDHQKPGFFLELATSSLETTVNDIIRKSNEIKRKENPDSVLVLGDTNSCLADYMAKRLHIPVSHMETGNRCFDFNVPEEINRRIINHVADFNLVYTEHAPRHLISEGLPHCRIYYAGSPMKEVLDYYVPKIKQSKALESLLLKAIFLFPPTGKNMLTIAIICVRFSLFYINRLKIIAFQL